MKTKILNTIKILSILLLCIYLYKVDNYGKNNAIIRGSQFDEVMSFITMKNNTAILEKIEEKRSNSYYLKYKIPYNRELNNQIIKELGSIGYKKSDMNGTLCKEFETIDFEYNHSNKQTIIKWKYNELFSNKCKQA